MTHKLYYCICLWLMLVYCSFIYGINLSKMQDYPTYRILPSDGNLIFPDNEQNKVFISFGGPTDGYHDLVNTLCQKSVKLDFFTHILGFTDLDLKCDKNFWATHGEFIEKNKRGYGYWLWKPYLIKFVLRHLNENDILIYADAGSTINPNGLQRLNEYVDLLNNSVYGVLSYQMDRFPEKCFTKKLLIDFFDMNDEMLNAGQCVATIVIIKKNKHSVDIIDKWYETASIYKLLDDTNIANENKEFIDHRHDQSIYSLLVKKYGSIKVYDEIYDLNCSDWAKIPIRGTQIKIIQ